MSVQCKASMDEHTKKLLSDFQNDVGICREGYDYTAHPEASIRIARSYMDIHPEFYFLEGWGTPLSVNNELCNKMDTQKDKKSHGGKRVGAGRKKGVPTENVRLVSPLAPQVKCLSDHYKSCSDNERQKITQAISALLNELSLANPGTGNFDWFSTR